MTKDLAKAVFAITLAFPIGLYNAYVMQQVWTWFVTPTFSVAAPSVLMLWGMSYLVYLTTARVSQDEMSLTFAVAASISKISIGWLMAFTIHLMT